MIPTVTALSSSCNSFRRSGLNDVSQFSLTCVFQSSLAICSAYSVVTSLRSVITVRPTDHETLATTGIVISSGLHAIEMWYRRVSRTVNVVCSLADGSRLCVTAFWVPHMRFFLFAEACYYAAQTNLLIVDLANPSE